MLYTLMWPLFWLFAHVLCRFHVTGREHISRSGPLLIVSNHLSWFDPILLGVIFPRRLWFLSKIEVFRFPLIGWACRVSGQIPVERGKSDRGALEMALEYLRGGRAVVIFPEGTVARQETMLAAHTGVAMLALRSGATILPVALTGTRRIFNAGFQIRPRVEIQIGQDYAPVMPTGQSRKVALKMVTEDLMQRIAAMLPAEEQGVYASSQVQQAGVVKQSDDLS